MLTMDRRGQGVPLVAVHAYPLSHLMWNPVAGSFSKQVQFISVDLPGFGTSPLTSSTSTMESMAESLLVALEKNNIHEKFIAMGISMGGYVVLQLLKHYSDRLRGIILVSTRAGADSDETREKRFKTIDVLEKTGGLESISDKMIPQLLGSTTLKTQPGIVSQVKEWIRSTSPESMSAALRGMAQRPDSNDLLPKINIPSLVLAGEEDSFIAPTEMEKMAQKIPSSLYEVVPQAGHLLPLEKSDQFVRYCLHFIQHRILV